MSIITCPGPRSAVFSHAHETERTAVAVAPKWHIYVYIYIGTSVRDLIDKCTYICRFFIGPISNLSNYDSDDDIGTMHCINDDDDDATRIIRSIAFARYRSDSTSELSTDCCSKRTS